MNYAETETPDSSEPQRGSIVTLPLIFVIGLIIYEVTRNPGMAAMAMCLKFGWEDFRTARWLNRTDPDRGRGRACSWLYLAAGLWQMAIIGVAMVILTVVLDEIIQVQRQGAAANLLSLVHGAVMALLFGFLFSTVSTYVALIYARRYGVRPWLNGAVHFARRHDQWPPLYGQRNRVMVLVLTTLIITFAIVIPTCFLMGAMILKPIIPMQILAGLATLLPLLCYVILLPASIVLVIRLRRQGFFADHPADCWGDDLNPRARRDETA